MAGARKQSPQDSLPSRHPRKGGHRYDTPLRRRLGQPADREPPLEIRLARPDQGMMQHPLAKAWGMDPPLLGLPDGKGREPAHRHGTREYFLSQQRQFRVEVRAEGDDIGLVDLAARRPQESLTQVGRFRELFQADFATFHIRK